MGRPRHTDVTVVAKQTTRDGRDRQVDPDQPRAAHLIVLSGANIGRIFKLEGPCTLIGRDEGAEIQILDAGISRQHAAVSHDGQGNYFLEDAGSRNGTFSNNRRVEQRQQLRDGDRIQIGSMTILRFAYADGPEGTYAEAMYQAALRDGLTGVFNRRCFEDRLQAECSFADRHGAALALLLIDVDGFKEVNDSLGHLAGDKVLAELARLVQRSSRTEDVLCRYGGDEFAMLCRETDLKKASIVAERIRHEISSHCFTVDGNPLQLTVSIGIAALPAPALTAPEHLVHAVDEALYQAKQRGRNCVVMHRPVVR